MRVGQESYKCSVCVFVCVCKAYALGRLWRVYGSGSFGYPRRPTCEPRPARSPAWRRWPPCCRTYSSSLPPSCCRHTLPQNYVYTHWSSASRSLGNASRSKREGKRAKTQTLTPIGNLLLLTHWELDFHSGNGHFCQKIFFFFHRFQCTCSSCHINDI